MGKRQSKYVHQSMTHPTSEPELSAGIFQEASREYFEDGKVLIRRPEPKRVFEKKGIQTMVYPDGSYIIGTIHPKTGSVNGYCEYWDIGNRIIYTGYMMDTVYNGWGSVWDETGSWPEYTTYWSMSRPGNRILHSTLQRMEWEMYNENQDKIQVPINPLPSGTAQIFNEVRGEFVKNQKPSERIFGQMIHLYTMLRSEPPSPNIGPKANTSYKDLPMFTPISPPTPNPDEKTTVFNPLRVRIPPMKRDN